MDWLIGIAVGLLVLAIGLVWRVTKGPGRRPVGLGDRVRYRGVARGRITAIDPSGRATVAYEVDGARYELAAPFRMEKRSVAHGLSSSGPIDLSLASADWEDYQTTSLGEIGVGGPIDVRYDPADPSRSVPVPNPHNPDRLKYS